MRNEHISYSEIETFQRCKKLWHYAYELGWAPVQREDRLRRGTWMHELLGAHYRGEPWEPKHSAMVDQLADKSLFEEELHEQLLSADLCAQVMARYVKQAPSWSAHLIDDDQMVGTPFVEIDLDLPLPSGITLRSRVDLLVRAGVDSWWVVDHKTTEDFDKGMELRTDFDPQLSFYIWSLRQLGYNVIGGIHNFIRMRVPAVPSVNKDGSLSASFVITDEETVMSVMTEGAKEPKGGLAAYLDKLPKDAFFRRFETVRTDEELTAIVREIDYKVRERALAREHSMYTRTMIQECQRCPFFAPCLAGLKGGDEQLILNERFRMKGEQEEHVADVL